MRCDVISDIVKKIVEKYHSNDPFYIADCLKTRVKYVDDFKQQKGCFAVIAGIPFILINANISEQQKRMICAHELGHAVLHKKICKTKPVLEKIIFDMSNQLEVEANIFAAELLLLDNKIIPLLKNNESVERISQELNVDINIVVIKLYVFRHVHPSIKIDVSHSLKFNCFLENKNKAASY